MVVCWPTVTMPYSRPALRFLTSFEPVDFDCHRRLVEGDGLRLVHVPPRVADGDVLVDVRPVGVVVVRPNDGVDAAQYLRAEELPGYLVRDVDVPRHHPHLYRLHRLREQVAGVRLVLPRPDARPHDDEGDVEPHLGLLRV